MSFLNDVSIKQVVLEKHRVAFQHMVGAEMAQSLKAEIWQDEILRGLLVRLSAYVQAERLPPHEATDTATLTVQVPSSWWQHFKYQYQSKWFMRSLVRRKPVKFNDKTATAVLTARWENLATYPMSNFVTPLDEGTFGRAVIVSTLKQDTKLWRHQ